MIKIHTDRELCDNYFKPSPVIVVMRAADDLTKAETLQKILKTFHQFVWLQTEHH